MGGACLASCWCCPVCSPWGHLARMLLFLTCTHSLCMWCACRAPARPPALQPLNGTPASPYTQQASPSSPHGPQDYDLQPTARMATQQQQQQLSTGGGSSSGGHPFSSAGSPPPPQLGRGDSLDRFRQDASPLLHGQGQGQGQGSPTGPGPVPAYLTPGGPPGQQHSGTASPYAYGDSSSGGAGAGVGRPPSSASPGGIVPIMYAPGAQVQYTPGYQQHYKLAQAEQQQQQQQWGGSGAQAEQQLQQQQQQWGQSGCSRVVTASPPQTAGSSGKYEFSTPWGLDVQQQQQQRGGSGVGVGPTGYRTSNSIYGSPAPGGIHQNMAALHISEDVPGSRPHNSSLKPIPLTQHRVLAAQANAGSGVSNCLVW